MRTLALAAALLGIAALVPLTPDGRSFAGIVAELGAHSPLQGLLLVMSFGGPFLFAFALLPAALLPDRVAPRRALLGAVALLQAQLVLGALRAWSADFGIAPLALVGFGTVSALYLAHASARASAEGEGPAPGPPVPWLARWGGLLVAAAAGWLRLSSLGGPRLGPALEVALAAGGLLVIAARRARLRPA
jgi:hypothetical protein